MIIIVLRELLVKRPHLLPVSHRMAVLREAHELLRRNQDSTAQVVSVTSRYKRSVSPES